LRMAERRDYPSKLRIKSRALPKSGSEENDGRPGG
jgi:hypothetical protein